MGGIRAVLVGAALVMLAAGIAVSSASATDWERTRISMDLDVLVLLSGCDGLIAEGGIPPTPNTGPPGYAALHNFVASVHMEGWSRRDPMLPLEASYFMHASIRGTGTDAAGRTFTVSGHVSQDGWEADFWADDGHITVRRDDGSFATDMSAGGAHPIVTAPVFHWGPTLLLGATRCHLR